MLPEAKPRSILVFSGRYHIMSNASPRAILVFSGRYHIMSNASIVNNCFVILFLKLKKKKRKRTEYSLTMDNALVNLSLFFFY